MALGVKNLPTSARGVRDTGLIPGSERFPEEGMATHSGILLFLIIYFNWRLLLYNTVVVLPYIDMNQPWVYMCPPSRAPLPFPSPSHPSGLSSAPASSALFHALNLDWSSVSHMVTYVFQCYAVKSSHPHLLPQSPKVCSLHLCLLCCLIHKVVVIIILNSIYMP